jgi:hypothetical protein
MISRLRVFGVCPVSTSTSPSKQNFVVPLVFYLGVSDFVHQSSRALIDRWLASAELQLSSHMSGLARQMCLGQDVDALLSLRLFYQVSSRYHRQDSRRGSNRASVLTPEWMIFGVARERPAKRQEITPRNIAKRS